MGVAGNSGGLELADCRPAKGRVGVRRQPAMRGPKMLDGDPGANNTSAPKVSSFLCGSREGKTNKQTGNRSAGYGIKRPGYLLGAFSGEFLFFFFCIEARFRVFFF